MDAAKRIEELKLPIVATPLGINETKKYTETIQELGTRFKNIDKEFLKKFNVNFDNVLQIVAKTSEDVRPNCMVSNLVLLA